MILFLINFFAIVIAALALFAFMGYGDVALALHERRAKRWSVVAIAVSTLIVIVPLGAISYRVASEQILLQRAKAELEDWLEGSDYEVYSVEINAKKVSAILIGDGEPPPFEDLLSAMRKRAGEMEIELRLVPEITLKGRT